MKVKDITAIGTRGDAKGHLFRAVPNSSGKYVLNKKVRTGTNKAANKVYVSNLTDAAELLLTDDYVISLTHGVNRALRSANKVTIEYY